MISHIEKLAANFAIRTSSSVTFIIIINWNLNEIHSLSSHSLVVCVLTSAVDGQQTSENRCRAENEWVLARPLLIGPFSRLMPWPSPPRGGEFLSWWGHTIRLAKSKPADEPLPWCDEGLQYILVYRYPEKSTQVIKSTRIKKLSEQMRDCSEKNHWTCLPLTLSRK